MPDQPFQKHSPTSKAASRKTSAVRDRIRVAQWLKRRWDRGLTDDQMQTKMDGNTQRPRRVELCERDLVINSGRKKPTGKGRQAVVWIWAASKTEVKPTDLSLTPEELKVIRTPNQADSIRQTKAELLEALRKVARLTRILSKETEKYL